MSALLSNIYKLPDKTQSMLVKKGSQRIAKYLKAYYNAEHQANPWKQLFKPPKTFNEKMLGSVRKPCLKAKRGQTRCLVKFCAQLMHKHKSSPNGKFALLAKVGDSLLKFYQVMEDEPRQISYKAGQRLIEHMVYVVLFAAAGGHLVYKHHGAVHLALNARKQGNPRHVSTYEDEHENGVCARIGARTHGLTFSKTIFELLEISLSLIHI